MAEQASSKRTPGVLAVVDLGSNSFHLVVARYVHGQLVVIDRMREVVRLGADIGDDGTIDSTAADRALACLQRFGQRLRDMHADSVRVVGTNALRQARRKRSFLAAARQALGHPIEIISGIEEARLIYCGVSFTSPTEAGRRLVIDIGGGSTELVIGEGQRPLDLESVSMGCVTFSRRFFRDGRISKQRFARARVAARLELEPMQANFKARGWGRVSGSSGTVRAIAESIARLDGQPNGRIERAGLETLVKRVLDVRHVRDLDSTGVPDERRPIFPGGLAILAETFNVFGLEQMHIADGALREGLLYDMVGRFSNEDARERTVRAMQKRYHVDIAQAERVETTALKFLAAVQEGWKLDDPLTADVLRWAARLHEVGLDVAHSSYHRHGAYLLENADMLGFPREEQRLLAAVVGGHRRKLSLEGLDDLVPPWDKNALYLIVLLRLAVLLHRGHGDTPLPPIELSVTPKSLSMRLPRRWLREHPLSMADLLQEVGYLRSHGFRLRVFGPPR